MVEILAIVSKAVFEKDARVGDKLIAPSDVWPVDRYNPRSPRSSKSPGDRPRGALREGPGVPRRLEEGVAGRFALDESMIGAPAPTSTERIELAPTELVTKR